MLLLNVIFWVLFLATALVSPVATAQDEEKPAGVIECEKAELAYLDKKVNEALIYLQRCRQALPDYLPALTLLGKIQSEYSRHDLAVLTFSQALSEGADAELFAIPWSRSLLASRNYKILTDYNGYEEFDASVRIEWLKARAIACLKQNEHTCARSSYAKLAALTTDITVPLGFAGLAIRDKNWQEASKQLDSAAAIDANDVRVWLAYSRLALSRQQHDDALDYVNKAFKMEPENPRVLRMLVDVYLANDQREQATATLKMIIGQSPDDPFAMLVSNSLSYNEKYAAMLSELKVRIDQFSRESKADNKELYYLQGLIAYQEGRYEQALKNFLLLHTQRAYLPQSLIMLARTYVALEKPAEAIKILESEQEMLLDGAPELMAMLIELFIEQGTVFKALPSWTKYAERYPDRLDVHLLEIKILFKRGLPGAMDKLDALYTRYPDSEEVARVYAVMLTRIGESKKALDIVNHMLDKAQNEAAWYNFKGALHLMLKQQEEAYTALSKALSLDESLLTARLNLAWLQYEKGEVNEALGEVVSLIAQYPSKLSIKQLYAGMLLSAGKFAEAKTEYEALYSLDNSQRSVIESLITIYQREDQQRRVIDLVSRLIELDVDVGNNLIRRAQLYVIDKQPARASVDLYKALSLADEDKAQILSIANVSLQAGNEKLTVRSLKTAIEVAPEDPLPLVKLAELYLNLEQTDNAESLLDASQAKFSDVPEYWILQGRLAEQKGQLELAAAHYHQVLTLNPSFDLAFAKLYTLTRYNVGVEAFETALKEHVANHPDGNFSRKLLGQYYYYRGQFEAAAEHYQVLVDSVEKDQGKAALARRLAQTYFHFDTVKAQELVATALKLDKDDPQIMALEGWSLVQQGALEEGLKRLREAYTLYGDNPDTQYFIAYTLAELELYDEAFEIIRQLLQTQVHYSYQNQAMALNARLAERANL
ncbi:tetratricopeptide repeat protein [Alteromonas gilva]|uniref:Tetratricopeptide repeat protein n=1 Tax=Alteromonas gilva TaxID=2987522 RepID=A0ABT5KY99_9ALTE|nr:tetratricopeptide repeat protein [Alteromonas gilva]MDC8829750.1 tetratricopeptide repeat protein [Alteromonas gilva]